MRYNLKEASVKLGLGINTLRRLVNTQQIQHHRPSERKIFFTEEDLATYEDSCKIVPKAREAAV